jgi:protease YdgD
LLLLTAAPASAPADVRPDGRILVDAMEYPWSAIGRVNAGGRGYCTGFLVGPRHVMTAAHCLFDFTEGRWRGANELHFVAGYQRDQFLIHSKVAS